MLLYYCLIVLLLLFDVLNIYKLIDKVLIHQEEVRHGGDVQEVKDVNLLMVICFNSSSSYYYSYSYLISLFLFLGEEELKGKGKELYEENEKNEEYLLEKKKRDAYVSVIDETRNDEEMLQLVEDGMRAAKRLKLEDIKKNTNKISGDNGIEDDDNNSLSLDLSLNLLPPPPLQSQSQLPSVSHSIIKEVEDQNTNNTNNNNENNNGELVSTESLSLDWIETINGEVMTHADGLIECIEGFGTVYVKNCFLGPTLQPVNNSSNFHYRYYYEVELITGGLFQVIL